MSDEQESTKEPARQEDGEPSSPDEPKLRRRPFGYSKRDVREVLDRQAADLGAREAELVELRQDIAALWLAFAQHDRMIRAALGEEPPDVAPPPPARETAPEPATEAPAQPAVQADDPTIGRQLSDLDDVLAAIELATQTLERTYVDDGEQSPEGEPPPGDVAEK